MKKLILGLVLAASGAFAQEATLPAPVARPSEAKLVTQRIDITATQAVISIDVKGSGNEQIRYYNVVVPDSAPATSTATITGFITALGTARSGETGSALRRFNFRCLGYLFDTGYLPGVTLAP